MILCTYLLFCYTLCILIEYKRPTLRDVYKYVVPKYAHEWRFLGGLLHFEQAELDIIFSDFRNDSKECCRRLLFIWLDKYSDASWNQLVSAIDEIYQSSLTYILEITNQGMKQFCYIIRIWYKETSIRCFKCHFLMVNLWYCSIITSFIHV